MASEPQNRKERSSNMEKQAAIWGTGYIANMHAVALKANNIPIRVAVDINE